MARPTLPDLTDNESTLLIKFIEFADRNNLTRVDHRDIHTKTKEFGIRPIMLRATFQNLCNKSILTLARERDESAIEDPYYYEINPTWADQITSYYEFMTTTVELSPPSQEIPAADRFVQITDNQLTEEIRQTLSSLSEALRGSNDLFATSEDRISISKEIDQIRDLVSEPRVRVGAVWDATKNNRLLRFLAEQTGSAFVQQAAILAISHLDKFLSIITSL